MNYQNIYQTVFSWITSWSVLCYMAKFNRKDYCSVADINFFIFIYLLTDYLQTLLFWTKYKIRV